MCDAVALAAGIIAVVGAAGTAVQQNENQRRQVNYQNRVGAAASANAAKAASANYVAVLERMSQARAAAANESMSASQAAIKAQGTLAAGATALGIGDGGVYQDLSVSIAQQAAQDHVLRMRNADWQQQQIMRSLDQIGSEQQSRVNQAAGAPVNGVDYVGILGRFGQDAVNIYGGYQSRQAAKNG